MHNVRLELVAYEMGSTVAAGVEPYSGTTYYSHQRIQVNVQVQTQYFEHGRSQECSSNVGYYKPLHALTAISCLLAVKQEWFPSLMPGNTYVPLVWFDEKGEIQPAFAAQFRDGEFLCAPLPCL